MNNKSAVLLDEYFVNIYHLEKSQLNYDEVDLNSFIGSDYTGFEKLLVSPLLYGLYKEEFNNFSGDLYIIDGESFLESPTHNNIIIDDSKAYEDLVATLINIKNPEISNISILIDDKTSIKKRDIEILGRLVDIKEVNFLLINKSTNRNEINQFIQTHATSDLWIIDSVEYTSFCYDTIQSGFLVLKNGQSMRKINSDVIFTIEVELKESINDIFSNKTDKIFSKLKKY